MLKYLKGQRDYRLRLASRIEEMIGEAKKAIKAGGDRVAGLKAVRDYFYHGPIANKGLIRKKDMADWAANWAKHENTVTTTYKGFTAHKCDTWTQGPYILATFNILEGLDLKKMGHNSADYIHALVEAAKLALADRDQYFADPK